MSKTQNPHSKVLVTGGGGYIASWIIKQLLDTGRNVHATVRDKSNMDKVGHLLKMAENSPGTLELFEADLLKQGSFDKAMKGCDLVMHTASPFKTGKIKNPQTDFVDPALDGTRNVLRSVNATDSVKRVVLTSSVVSIYGDAKEILDAPNGIFTEESWNTSSSLTHQPYGYSKVLAEKEAWKISKSQSRWDLIVINPSFVQGPTLSNRLDSTSTNTMRSMLDGTFKMGLPELSFGVVDVRDVARAHILAGDTQEAKGRYITSNKVLLMMEIANILKQKYGDKYPLPKRQLPKFLIYLFGPFQGFTWKFTSGNVGYRLNFDNSKVQKELGLKFRPVEETLIEGAEQIIERGLVKS